MFYIHTEVYLKSMFTHTRETEREREDKHHP